MDTQFLPTAAHKASRIPRQRVLSIIGLAAAALIVVGPSAATTQAHAALPQDSTIRPFAGEEPLEPTTLNVVALGDSYTSGHGASEAYDDDTCRRSSSSYAPVVYNRLKATFQSTTSEFVNNACTGAITLDVINNQLGALSESTDLVILTIGGNDLHFGDVARTCLLNGSTVCTKLLNETGPKVETMKQPIIDVLNAIAVAAPKADIVMSGYPLIFETGACGTLSIAEENRDQMRGMQMHFNEVIQSAAEGVNDARWDSGSEATTFYSDPDLLFNGHHICDSEPWLNEVIVGVTSLDPGAAYHPNADGHVAMAQAVFETIIGGATKPTALNNGM